MQRITISIDDTLLDAIDRRCRDRGYASRSEAVRDIVREATVEKDTEDASSGPCCGVLSYVYDHDTRDLARRLTGTGHHHHDVSIASLHVHLDRQACLEVAVLRGRRDAMQAYADSVTTQRGVRYGRLNMIPETQDNETASTSHAHP